MVQMISPTESHLLPGAKRIRTGGSCHPKMPQISLGRDQILLHKNSHEYHLSIMRSVSRTRTSGFRPCGNRSPLQGT
ncbi:unnamed protein product [Musa banksii]